MKIMMHIRQIDKDVSLVKDIHVDYVFHPSAQEMYPDELGVTLKVGRLGKSKAHNVLDILMVSLQ